MYSIKTDRNCNILGRGIHDPAVPAEDHTMQNTRVKFILGHAKLVDTFYFYIL